MFLIRIPSRLIAPILGFAIMFAATDTALAASCNGRVNTPTFMGAGLTLAVVGGSHEAGETTTFTVLSGMFAGGPGVLEIRRNFDGNSLLCAGNTCNGASFTAPNDGDFKFTITGRTSDGNPGSVQAKCVANTTGVDDDADAKTSAATTPEANGTSGPQIATNLNTMQGSIRSARLPMTPPVPNRQLASPVLTYGPQSATFFLSSNRKRNGGAAALMSYGPGGENRGFEPVPEGSPWHIWSQLRVTSLQSNNGAAARGPVVEGRIGAGYRVSDGTTVGAFVNGLSADLDMPVLATAMRQTAVGGGAYVSHQLTGNWRAGLQAYGEGGRAKITAAGASGNTGISRFVVSGSVHGDYRFGRIDVAPRVLAGYVNDLRNAYVDSAGRTIAGNTDSYAFGSLGVRLSSPMPVQSGAVEQLVPYFDASLDAHSAAAGTITTVGGVTVRDNAVTGSVNGGFDARLANRGLFSLGGGVSGIGNSSYGLFGEARLRIPLN